LKYAKELSPNRFLGRAKEPHHGAKFKLFDGVSVISIKNCGEKVGVYHQLLWRGSARRWGYTINYCGEAH
jgi:hypothetical protein